MIRFRRLRLWWAGQHARYRLPWCYQCRLGWGARRSGEFYEHDEPRWLVVERYEARHDEFDMTEAEFDALMERAEPAVLVPPPARTYATGVGQNWYWDREYGLRRLS